MVYNHLRNATYLDSTLPFSEGEPGSLGMTANVVCLASHVSYILICNKFALDLSRRLPKKTKLNRIRPRGVFWGGFDAPLLMEVLGGFSWGGSTKSIIDLHLFAQVFCWGVFMHPSFP